MAPGEREHELRVPRTGSMGELGVLGIRWPGARMGFPGGTPVRAIEFYPLFYSPICMNSLNFSL